MTGPASVAATHGPLIVRWGVVATVALTTLGLTQPGRAGDDAPQAPRTAAVAPPERCLDCHADSTGIEPSHATIGCTACHLGVARARDERTAHEGLVRIPGNASDAARTCGAAGCHPQMPARLELNVMSTMNGVVSVDRWVFGEQPTPTAYTPVSSLGESRADTHLRGLCVSCHLTAEKTQFGPITEQSRGGGCNACHLRAVEGRRGHAQLRAKPSSIHCFGCHSRSGRVSLNYEGWREAPDGPRVLADGRRLAPMPADVHASKGLECVDCHGSWEVMGDGNYALHKENQLRVRCEDCHSATPRTVRFADADDEVRRVTRLRGGDTSEGRRFVVLQRSGLALAGTVLTDQGPRIERGGACAPESAVPLQARGWVGDLLDAVLGLGFPSASSAQPTCRTISAPAAAPSAACRAKAHQALACSTCHDAWAPQCLGCHTSFNPKEVSYDLLAKAERPGRWVERAGDQLAEPASLGVREVATETGVERRVEEFTPGMILTLDGRFRRLFAPTFPHTVQRASRSCQSCHADPLALGYGRGRLDFSGARWRFTPARPLAEDGLPDDAWIRFLSQPTKATTTRETTRPFTLAEQRRVLTVGACLSCHADEAPQLAGWLDDFDVVLARRSRECVLPTW